MTTPHSKQEIWVKFAQLVQHANVANCNHASTQFVRETNRFIASRKNTTDTDQLLQDRSERLADLIMDLRNTSSDNREEIHIKRQCLEILVEMKRLTEETAPLLKPQAHKPLVTTIHEPEESELDKEFRRLAG